MSSPNRPFMRSGAHARTHERGTVLVIVLVLIMAMAILALSAIGLSSSDAVHTLSYSAERDFRSGVETALRIGKSRLTHDTTISLPDSGFVTLMSHAKLPDVNGNPLRGVTVDLYAGVSRRENQRDGAFVSIVAEARDARDRTRYVRMLELRAESVASGASYLRLSRLSVLHDYARRASTDIIPSDTSLTSTPTRIEFVAIDVNDDGDVDDTEEGFFRTFVASDTSSARDDRCGDWHDVLPGSDVLLEFFPTSVHDDEWFIARGIAHPARPVMRGPGARCYQAGDPHLVAVERVGAAGYAPTDWQKGGSDTTFTPIGNSGQWLPFPSTVPEILNAIPAVRHAAEAQYLWPLHTTLNPTSTGVIHVHGPVLVSGMLRGRVTLYSSGSVEVVDALRYAGNPATESCANLLGVIAEGEVRNPDNSTLHGLIVYRAGPGFVARRSDDRCPLADAPPHFPTTGRFIDGRYYEVDPARFDPAALFQSLQAGP